jgi:uncharacterized protein YkwD
MAGSAAKRALALVSLAAVTAVTAIGALDSGEARATTGPCPDADTNSALISLAAFDNSVFCLINQRRAENGLRALRSNGLLRDAALIYATSMLSGKFYGHDGCLAGKNNCSTPIGRLKFLNYIGPRWTWIVGEVLRGAHPDTATPNLVVQAWMDSPIHRVELLKPKFREIGVASVRGITDSFPSIEGVTTASEFGFRILKKKFRKKKRGR